MVNIDLEYDVWHLMKRILKEVRQIKELQPWLETIKNFLWFSVNKAEGNYGRLLEYLRSIPDHLVGVHSFQRNQYLMTFPHPDNYKPENKMFLNPNSLIMMECLKP